MNAESVHSSRSASDLVIVRRTIITLLAVLVGAGLLAVAPIAAPAAVGEGDPTLAISVDAGRTGTPVGVTGHGCYLPDGVTGADGLLLQLIAPDGTAAAGGTLPVQRDGTWDAPFVVPDGVPRGTYSVRGTCIAPMYEDLGVLAGGTFTVTGAGPPVPEREPATPRFPSQIEPYPEYDGQSTCTPAAKPGMLAYRDLVMAAYPGTSSYGISRDCAIGGTSEHKEGRAWDWAVDANSAADRRKVANLVRWLLRTDEYGHRHAMARRLGVMYIIWNRQIFRLYRADEGWTAYTGSSPHTDHVHVSLTRRGGDKRTSFWTLRLPGPGPGPGPEPPPAPNPGLPRGPRAEFDQTEQDVSGHFQFARPGDFDGNGTTDILWYGVGARPEHLSWGRQGRAFTDTGISAPGRLRPLVGDYDGDGRDDILWYRPGAGDDDLWFGRADRTWDVRHVAVTTRYAHALVGDYDADGRADIFWYGPGADADRLWFGRADRRFAGAETSVSGTYRPAVGDFDGDRSDDLLWYAPGAAADFLWFGNRDRTFTSTDRTIDVDLDPIVGDFNANGRDDLFWYAPGAAADKLWWGRADRSFASGAVANVSGTYEPAFAGDFDEDRDDDIFWYRAGTPVDYIWWFR